MQTPDDGDELTLTFYCKSADSYPNPDCPTWYRASIGGWFGQGEVRDDPKIRTLVQNLKDHEGYLWFPEELMDTFVRMYAKERYGVDLG